MNSWFGNILFLFVGVTTLFNPIICVDSEPRLIAARAAGNVVMLVAKD